MHIIRCHYFVRCLISWRDPAGVGTATTQIVMVDDGHEWLAIVGIIGDPATNFHPAAVGTHELLRFIEWEGY